MPLTAELALRAYAKMLNTLDSECVEHLLADDFIYESQQVLQPLETKNAYLEYMRQKLKTIKKANATVFAEMGTVDAYTGNQPCVILAQNNQENLVGLVFVKTEGDFIKRIDLCVVPPPHTAKRSGEYPT